MHTAFPVSLLAEGRTCLVIGGGKVAARKVRLLLDACADVTVISPDICDEMQQIVKQRPVRWISRKVEDGDVKDAFLVFAATNDRAVNRRVLTSCNAARVLCCCVDGNWSSSDFVTPATLRKEGLTVSVATGGQSCRRSRIVKENLARHIEMVETTDMIVIGTDHNHLELERREPLHLADERLDQMGRMLGQIWGVHEFVILNTCNRVEVLAAVSQDAGTIQLICRLLGFEGLREEEYYVRRGYDALEHTALLMAGLLSQAPGEYHIVSQVKDALAAAVRAGRAGGIMQEWADSALHVSKAIRDAVGPQIRDAEIEDLCLDYVAAAGPALHGRAFVVVGAGVVGRGVVERWVAKGGSCDWYYHLNKPEVPAAWSDRVRLLTLNQLRTHLAAAGVVVCTTSSEGYVLHKGHAPFFDLEHDVLVMDLSIPRNVEPALDKLTATLRVLDLDDLKRWYWRSAVDVTSIIDTGRRIVGGHRELYDKIVRSFQSGRAEQ